MDYRNYMPFGYGQIPFYSGFRYSLDSSQEMIMEKDKEYMKSLYPVKAKEIQALVEDECDKLEYEGSIMFDEYPDKIGLRKIGMDVYNKISKNEAVVDAKEESKEEDIYMMNYGYHYRQPMPPPKPKQEPCNGPGCNDGSVMDMIDVLLFNEMYKRRCRHDRCRRRLYW